MKNRTHTHTHTLLEISIVSFGNILAKIREAGEEYLQRYVESEDGQEKIDIGGEVAFVIAAGSQTKNKERVVAEAFLHTRLENSPIGELYEVTLANGDKVMGLKGLKKIHCVWQDK